MSGKLAHALGDPSLIVAYRVPNGDGFVDEAGRSVTLPSPGSGRTVTGLVDRGEQVAVLVHDETLLADPQLAASVAAAARVALANASLHAAARARAAEVAASRRRIVEAAAVERLEIQRQLQRGAGRRLETVASVLADIRAGVGEADATLVAVVAGELEATRLELQEFARGLHPATLTGGGLVPALAQVAERSPIPVEVRGTVGRLPTPVEAALFFVCSEALANVAKHAAASVATIDVRVDANGVTLEIADDGRGGADAGGGSGLAGLVDRVEALGGRLRIESEAGRGTRLVARLPLRNGRASAAL